MIIYRSLNKSFQFIRSVPINDKNSQNDHYHYDYVMMLNFQENWDVRGEGGLKIRAHADKGGLKIRTHVTCGQGGRGVKNGQTFADVLYGWPLRCQRKVKSIQ